MAAADRAAFAWRLERAKAMYGRNPDALKELRKPKKIYFFAIPLIVFLQMVLAIYSGGLSYVTVFFLSATIGAFLAFGLHDFLHELSHRNIPWTQSFFVPGVLSTSQMRVNIK